MWFVGMLFGLCLGGIAWGFGGAAILGFFGFLGGLIFANRKQDAKAGEGVPGAGANDRLTALEQRVAELEARLTLQECMADGPNAASESEAPAVAGPVPGMPADNAATALAANIRVAGSPAIPLAGSVPVQPAAAATTKVSDSVSVDPGRPLAPPAVPAPPQPSQPPRPNFIVRWFTEGNAIVRIGVTILFIGIAFLVRYAADHDMVPIELRLASAAVGGITLLVFGWRLRTRRAGYALTLQGAGVAVLYLTLFGAFRLWRIVPVEFAFPLLVLVAVLSAYLAVKQNSMAMAVVGSAGGFLAPILASTGSGSHVMLFSYYLVLNMGILAVAWHKAWRPLNLLGFLFTFAIGLLWGDRYYRPELFASTEPFLVLHLLLYVLVAVLFAHRQAPRVAHYVDGTLIFGVPLVAFGLQYALVKEIEYGLALSSLVLATFYLALARVLHARQRDSLRLLVESFLALGVVFATLAIPLALDAHWTSAAWALEGAGIVWIGVRQRRLLARFFGMLLQLIAGAAFVHGFDRAGGPYPIVNSLCLGALLLVLGGLVTYRQLANARDASAGGVSKVEHSMAATGFAWALFWWLVGGVHEIDRFIPGQYQVVLVVAFVAGTALAASLLWHRRAWGAGAMAVFGLLPLLFLLSLVQWIDHAHPFAHGGWLAWPVALCIQYANLRRHEGETDSAHLPTALGLAHAGTLLLVAILGAWELHWLAGEAGLRRSAWSVASAVMVPGLVLLGLGNANLARRWPRVQHDRLMLTVAGVPLAVALWVWTFYANLSHGGSAAPLPYLPLLNAIDLAHLFLALVAVALWRAHNLSAATFAGLLQCAAAAATFVWLNAVLLRTIHHWANIPYRFNNLWSSMLVQASVSLFWTLLALALMLTATRKGLRSIWMLGAVLMGAVVVKLFLVDLSNIDGIERIVSFIGVGVLMAVIGYFSPLPPRQGVDSIPEAAP